MTWHLVKRFTDAHTWPRRVVRVMVGWVVITVQAVAQVRRVDVCHRQDRIVSVSMMFIVIFLGTTGHAQS